MACSPVDGAVDVRDTVVRAFRMDIVQVERARRIVILYHSIAIVVAIEAYMITGLLRMKEPYRLRFATALVTAGYLMAIVFGMGFPLGPQLGSARLYLAGLTLVFAAEC